ncbi:MAG: TylF/MycF/NovP-related O-methyltransferase [Stellaceae bacterium]
MLLSKATAPLIRFFLLMKFYLPKLEFGHIIEFGSFRGGSAFFMGVLAKKFLPGAQVYSPDTFEGMPVTDKVIDAHNARDFATTSLDEIETARARLGLGNVHFVRGLFSATAEPVLRAAKQIRLAHIDCDIYDSVLYSYAMVKPHMVPLGYYVFDDSTEPTCIGASEVVEDIVIRRDGLLSEQVYPHHVFRAPLAAETERVWRAQESIRK